MRYAQIRKMDISNGEGIGVSLFVQGCHFHCKGCFNQETWDFNGGKEWDEQTEREFISLASPDYIKRISILGGEPLADENIAAVSKLIRRLKEIYPEKMIWIYTGYTWDTLDAYGKLRFIQDADVLVDGQFQLDKQDLFNKYIVFAGSTNQRIIDVQASIANEEIVYWR